MIGNIMIDALSAKKYYHFIRFAVVFGGVRGQVTAALCCCTHAHAAWKHVAAAHMPMLLGSPLAPVLAACVLDPTPCRAAWLLVPQADGARSVARDPGVRAADAPAGSVYILILRRSLLASTHCASKCLQVALISEEVADGKLRLKDVTQQASLFGACC
jgi:hypothetical protein